MKKYFYFLFISVLFSSQTINAQMIDVWDFGATQLDSNLYNNLLNETIINSWYPSSITPGSVSTTNLMPVSFTAGALSWSGGTSDRLRTTNTLITRYDTNIASVTTHNGRIYCNGNAAMAGNIASSRYLSINLAEDDEVKVIADLARLKEQAAKVDGMLLDCVKLEDIQLEFVNAEGDQVKRWRSTILSQAIHHASEHRSQIASALDAKGFTPVNLDDLDLWSYEKDSE